MLRPQPPLKDLPPPILRPATLRTAEQRRRGGAWKVAYADFVTALMALFIVLWLMNASGKVKQSVSGYFTDPRAYSRNLGAGRADSEEGLLLHHGNMGDMQKQIEAAMRRIPEFLKVHDNIRMSVTGEGLRIDLLENEQGLFFLTGSASPSAAGEHLLQQLATEIAKMPNSVVIEGHTDARAFRNAGPSSGYSNWELSTDRANAARRLLHAYGVRPQQVVEVRGYADQKLLNAADPNDPKNRRVSLVVRFLGDEGGK